MGFRYFSVNYLDSYQSQDNEFLELDAKEVNKGEGFKEGSEFDIHPRRSLKTLRESPLIYSSKEDLLSELVDLVFKEPIGLENMPENKRLNSEIGGMGNLQPESQLEKI
jgi:hypothetical protein